MDVNTIKDLTKDILFNEKGESLRVIDRIDILDIPYDQLKNIPHDTLLKIQKQLNECIKISMLLETHDFTANCNYCIDIKYHECLSGTGNYLYTSSVTMIDEFIKENRKRGFEYVSEFHRKNDELAELPRRGTSKSSGYDFFLPCDVTIEAHSKKLVFSDVKSYMLDDEELLLFPRSSMAKLDIKLANSIGKIDSDFYSNIKNDGNIGIWLQNTSDIDVVFKKGDRICQGSFYKYLITDDDNPVANERVGGMGSTGK